MGHYFGREPERLCFLCQGHSTHAAYRGGSIVNIASIRAVVAGANTVQYDTTKAAVAGLTRSMARDHALQAYVSMPCAQGQSLPAFMSCELPRQEIHEAFTAEFGQDTMLKRPGTPREVAACVLLSDEASFVTGTCLFVDGGQTAQ